MYAIIRAGGKQAKVREGDVIDVERIKEAGDEISFTPLLLVADDGTVVSDREALQKASVSAKVVGESRGEKIDIFKYKNKTGYRRRQGHRQTYTRLEVTKIKGPKKAAAKTKAAAAEKKTETDEEA
jgi:large subunit ribosomal protein L21